MTSKLWLIVFSLLLAQSCAQLTLYELIGVAFNEKTIETTTQIPNAKATRNTSTHKNQLAYKACGVNKECVPQHLCINGAISTTSELFIDVRFGRQGCQHNEICCKILNQPKEPVVQFPNLKVIQKGCGWRNVDGVGLKITGDFDNEVQFGEFPWMVAIFHNETVDSEIINLYDCGGSLIAPNVVLTAAHCVIQHVAHQLKVRAGERDIYNTHEMLDYSDKRVKEIIIHEQYNKAALYNDVALLLLEQPFVWQENIRPICLPPESSNFDFDRCYSTGWGKNKYGRDGKYQTILKKVDLPIVPHNMCESYLRQTRLGLYYNLHESFLCAGGEKNKDTCKGDGGSPLVCPIPGFINRFYQAGIVSWGVGCAEENVPGVYANVAHLRLWISKTLSAKGIQFLHFTP